MEADSVLGTLKKNLEIERYQLSRAVGVLMDLSRVIHTQPKYDWNADPENLTRRMGDVFVDNTDIITGMNRPEQKRGEDSPEKPTPEKNSEPPENTYLIGYRETDGAYVYGVHGSNRVVYGPQYDAYHGNVNESPETEEAETAAGSLVYPCMSPNATHADTPETPKGFHQAPLLPGVMPKIPDLAEYRREWEEAQANEREARYERFERLEAGFINYFAANLESYLRGSGIHPDELRFEEHFERDVKGENPSDLFLLAHEAVFETHQDFDASVRRIRQVFLDKGWVLSVVIPAQAFEVGKEPKRVVRIIASQNRDLTG